MRSDFKYWRLANKLALQFRYALPGYEFDDLVGVACEGILKALNDYDPSKAKELTHAYNGGKFALIQAIRLYRGRENQKIQPIYIDSQARAWNNVLDESPDSTDAALANTVLIGLFDDVEDPKQKRVRERVLQGLLGDETLVAMSKDLAVSSSRVYQIVEDIRVRLARRGIAPKNFKPAQALISSKRASLLYEIEASVA